MLNIIKNKAQTSNIKNDLNLEINFFPKLFKISERIYFLKINFEKFENVLENYFRKICECFENLE